MSAPTQPPALNGHPPNDPSQTVTGTCLCTAISVTLQIPPSTFYSTPNGHICHCTNCRKQTSSAGGLSCLLIPTTALSVSDPDNKLKTFFDNTSDSGRVVPRSFCVECGSPVGAIPTALDPGLSIVGLGLFERVPEPEFECYTKSRVGWRGKVGVGGEKGEKGGGDGVAQFEMLGGLENFVPAGAWRK